MTNEGQSGNTLASVGLIRQEMQRPQSNHFQKILNRTDMQRQAPTIETFKSIATSHLRSFYPNREIQEFTWTAGPGPETLPGLTISRISPCKPDGGWIYASNGASQTPTQHGLRREFVLLAPSEDPIHIETITMFVHFLQTYPERSSPGSVVNIGRSWIDGAVQSRLLVSLPYPMGPDFEFCATPEASLQYLWLLPITADEAAYLDTLGADALEQRFDDHQINFLDPQRQSVV